MKDWIDSGGHVTQSALRDFAAGSLSHDELMEVAEHIADCEQCARSLAEMVETKQPAVPAGFEEEVLSRISREKEKKKELLHFSFRVAIAACGTLFFVFSSTMNTLASHPNAFAQIKAPGFSAVGNINTHLRNFSQQILDMEVFNNAKETK